MERHIDLGIEAQDLTPQLAETFGIMVYGDGEAKIEGNFVDGFSRGGIGITLVRLTGKNGNVAGIHHVRGDEQLLMVTERGMMIRFNIDEIRRIGRATQGVRVIQCEENDVVVSAIRTAEPEPEDRSGRADGQTTGEKE